MKKSVLFFLLLISASFAIYTGIAVFTKEEISQGQKIYESVRESSANNGGITLSEKDAYILSEFIGKNTIQKWRSNALGFVYSVLVFILVGWFLYSERKST